MKLTAILLLLVSQVIAQATKKVVNETAQPKSKETYYVLKDDLKTLQGPYKMDYEFFVIEGNYDNGQRSGKWKYYYKKDLMATLDQSTGEAIFAKKQGLSKTYKIKDGEKWIDVKLDSEPMFLGGNQAFFNFIGFIMRYPATARRMAVQGDVWISAVITKEGRVTDVRVIKGPGSGLDEEALRTFNLIPQEWYPGSINGEKTDIQIELRVIFRLS